MYYPQTIIQKVIRQYLQRETPDQKQLREDAKIAMMEKYKIWIDNVFEQQEVTQ